MSKIFFTSDTHFNHSNIIKYCDRPFKNSEDMDETIIHRFNEAVGPDDEWYHLGDFMFGPKDDFEYCKLARKYLDRLNGKRRVLIWGNHDKRLPGFKALWDSTYDLWELRHSGMSVTLCHYAMRTWNKSHHGAWHLYGHSHGQLPDDPNSFSIDAGVDCHDFRPLSIPDIAKIMSAKQGPAPLEPRWEKIKEEPKLELNQLPKHDVHTSHCCKIHGCKYGNEDCTIMNGPDLRGYACEICGLEASGYYGDEIAIRGNRAYHLGR